MNACDVGRERVHAFFDEAPDGPVPDGLQAHFATCAGCRELHEELTILRAALRARPLPPMPDEALDAVWERTVRAPRAHWLDTRRRAAVAAVLVTGVSLSTLWLLTTSAPPGPTAAEIARAEAQADLVLAYTARAFAATRTATTRSVVGSKISPAVRGDVPSDSRRH